MTRPVAVRKRAARVQSGKGNVTIDVRPETYERLRAVAESCDRTISGVVERVIRAALDFEESKEGERAAYAARYWRERNAREQAEALTPADVDTYRFENVAVMTRDRKLVALGVFCPGSSVVV